MAMGSVRAGTAAERPGEAAGREPPSAGPAPLPSGPGSSGRDVRACRERSAEVPEPPGRQQPVAR